MSPDELSEDEKWARFHAAMATEKEYIAIQEEQKRQRERTRRLINWAAAFWLFFALCAIASRAPLFRDLNELLNALGRL